MVTQAYTISTVKNAAPTRVKMSQYDHDSRTIVFTVVNGSGSVMDLTGKTVSVEGTRVDGHAFTASCAVNGNNVSFTETVDMTNQAGDHPAELVISNGSDRLGTMNFVISVEPCAMDENASITPEDQSLFDQLYTSIDDAEAEIGTAKDTALQSIDTAKDTALQEIAQGLASGSPLIANTAAEMTNTDEVYLYTGSESGYTAGSWYYYNGSAWVIGGVYGAGTTDATLTLSGVAADAKATGDAIGEVNGRLGDVGNLDFSIFTHTNWVVGGLTSSGEDTSSGSTYRAGNYFKITDDISEIDILIESGFKYYPVIYDNAKNAISTDKQAWGTGEKQYKKVDFPTMRYFRVAMRRDDNTIQDGDYTHIHGYATNNFYGLTKEVEILPYISNANGQIFSNGLVWVVGSINSNGGNSSSTTVIKTNGYVDVENYSKIDFQLQNGYKFGWHFYDANKTHLKSASAYVTESSEVDVPAGAKYLRINLTDASGSIADLSWSNNIAFYGLVRIVAQVQDATKELNSIFGTGENVYTGEKIKLKQETVSRKCNIELWKSYTLSEFSDIADYKLHANQSMAIYNGYVFLLGSGGTVTIIDYSTKELVSYLTTDLTNRNHQNSAQFSNFYYETGDTYPLLFVARCGNASSGTGDDTCLVYRVQQNGNAFSFTLVNTITTDITTHGNSWGIDVNKKTISMVGYVNDVYSVVTNNPVCMYQWKLPTRTEIISGNAITLTKEQCIAESQIAHEMLQSICSYAGVTYIGIVSNAKTYVYAVNIETGEILSIVPLVSTREIEGVAVYDGKMYVSHKNVNDTAGTNPLWIYELQF